MNNTVKKFDDAVIGKMVSKTILDLDLTKIYGVGIVEFGENDAVNMWKRPSLLSKASDIAQLRKTYPMFDDEIALIEEWIKEGADWPGQMDERLDRVGPR